MSIGKMVWWMGWDSKRGPLPAVVISLTDGLAALSVLANEGPMRIDCTHWLTEDGTNSGWIEIPADFEVPPDLFE